MRNGLFSKNNNEIEKKSLLYSGVSNGLFSSIMPILQVMATGNISPDNIGASYEDFGRNFKITRDEELNNYMNLISYPLDEMLIKTFGDQTNYTKDDTFLKQSSRSDISLEAGIEPNKLEGYIQNYFDRTDAPLHAFYIILSNGEEVLSIEGELFRDKTGYSLKLYGKTSVSCKEFEISLGKNNVTMSSKVKDVNDNVVTETGYINLNPNEKLKVEPTSILGRNLCGYVKKTNGYTEYDASIYDVNTIGHTVQFYATDNLSKKRIALPAIRKCYHDEEAIATAYYQLKDTLVKTKETKDKKPRQRVEVK